jgi:hypothetical protein
MYSLIDLNSYGAIIKIQNSNFENFQNCGSIIANRFYPDTEIMKNLIIDPQNFATELNIVFDVDKQTLILTELANSISSNEITFSGFTHCENDQIGDSDYEACFQIEITDSNFQQLYQIPDIFYKTGHDLSDSIVPRHLASFLSLHQYKGSLIIHNNNFSNNILNVEDVAEISNFLAREEFEVLLFISDSLEYTIWNIARYANSFHYKFN